MMSPLSHSGSLITINSQEDSWRACESMLSFRKDECVMKEEMSLGI